jgi:hypothetical protein
VQDGRVAPVAQAGWLDGPDVDEQPRGPSGPDRLFVAAYGQSFMTDLLLAAQAADARFEFRFAGGPAAPLSHVYKRYELDRPAHQAKIVVLGVLASALHQLTTLTPMTESFEAPTPYTYPRYVLAGGELREIPAPLADLAALRQALADPAAWSAFRASLARSDAAFYAPIFDGDLLDGSTIGRLVRRALGHRHGLDFQARYHGPRGFTNADHLLDVSRALFARFAATARADGRRPLVVLFDDRGYAGHLEAAFATTLDGDGIEYVSSETVAPSTDPANLVADGHFTPEVNRRLGAAFLQRLR